MDFLKATDTLIERVTLSDIAQACGVSENLIQRARMSGEPGRTPPNGWELAIAKLARRRAAELLRLADRLEAT